MDRHQGLQCNDSTSSFFFPTAFVPRLIHQDVMHLFSRPSMLFLFCRGRSSWPRGEIQPSRTVATSRSRSFDSQGIDTNRPPIRRRSPPTRPPSPSHPVSPLHPRWCIFPALEGSTVPLLCSLAAQEGASATNGVHLPRAGGARMARAHRPSLCVCDATNVDVRRFDACLATSGTRDGREESTANGGAPACHTGTPWAGSVVPRPPCEGPQKSECETAWRRSTCRRKERKEEVHGKDADGRMEHVCRRS